MSWGGLWLLMGREEELLCGWLSLGQSHCICLLRRAEHLQAVCLLRYVKMKTRYIKCESVSSALLTQYGPAQISLSGFVFNVCGNCEHSF